MLMTKSSPSPDMGNGQHSSHQSSTSIVGSRSSSLPDDRNQSQRTVLHPEETAPRVDLRRRLKIELVFHQRVAGALNSHDFRCSGMVVATSYSDRSQACTSLIPACRGRRNTVSMIWGSPYLQPNVTQETEHSIVVQTALPGR